jgi:hypothetical protein
MGWYELDSFAPEKGLLEGSHEHGNELSGSNTFKHHTVLVVEWDTKFHTHKKQQIIFLYILFPQNEETTKIKIVQTI